MKEAGRIRVSCLYGIWGAGDGKQESIFLYHVIASVNHIIVIEGNAVHGVGLGLVSRDAVLKGMGHTPTKRSCGCKCRIRSKKKGCTKDFICIKDGVPCTSSCLCMGNSTENKLKLN